MADRQVHRAGFEPNASRVPCVRGRALLLLSVLLPLSPGAATAQTTLFSSVPTWRSGPADRTRSVAVGDVDLDGDYDLVCANDLDGCALYFNDAGVLRPTPGWRSAPPAPSTMATNVALADVDRDGDLDLIVGLRGAGAAMYRNDGGTFPQTPSWTSGGQGSTVRAEPGDIDNDGRIDLVVADGYGQHRLYLNLGTTFATQSSWSPLPSAAFSLVLADVDGDRDLDVLVGGNPWNVVFRNDGGVLPPEGLAIPGSFGKFSVGDVDADGDLDLVCDEVGAKLHANLGNGTFDPVARWEAAGFDGSTGSVLADLDGDGDLDVVCTGGSGLTAYLNAGGTFSAAPDWTVAGGGGAALGDLTGDGDVDLITFASGASIEVRANLRIKGFEREAVWRSSESFPVEGIGLGDVDGDGRLDVAAATRSGPALLYLQHADTLDRTSARSFTKPGATKRPLFGDVDGDGDLDLVLTSYIYDEGHALYRNNRGVFTAEPVWRPTQPWGTDAVLADVNGDDRPDLITGSARFRNLGSTFETNPSWSLISAEGQPAVGDVDRDGDPDLVVRRVRDLALYLNVGGQFGSAPVWISQEASQRAAVVVGDVNGDGYADIVWLGFYAGHMVFVNHAGSFETVPTATIPAFSETYDGALADVDGDADLDLVSTTRYEGNVIHLNEGGAFTTSVRWAGIDFPAGTRLALGDMDRDGDLDYVAGSHADTRPVRIHRGTLVPTRKPGGGVNGGLANNNCAIRAVTVEPIGDFSRRVRFELSDRESDPVWLVPEFQFEATPWQPARVDVPSAGALGPFPTDPQGGVREFVWNLSSLPIDPRPVSVRLRAVSQPAWVGPTGQTAMFIKPVGPLRIQRPIVLNRTPSLALQATVGDTSLGTVTLGNGGNRSLTVSSATSSVGSLTVPGAFPVSLAPGQDRSFSVRFAPRAPESVTGVLTFRCNDPEDSLVTVSASVSGLALAMRAEALVSDAVAALGEAITVQATPAPGVHIDAVTLRYRSRLPAGGPYTAVEMASHGGTFIATIPGDAVRESGIEYFIEFTNSGFTGFDPVAAPDVVHFQPVATPAGVTVTPLEASGGGHPAGTDQVLYAKLPAGAQFERGWIHFRAGGATTYDSLDLAVREVVPGLTAPAATIPAASVGPRGLEYWALVETRSARITDPAVEPAGHPRSHSTDVATLIEPALHPGQRFRMISIPLLLDLPSSSSLEAILSDQPEFGPYDPARWRAFRWLPDRSSYAEVSDASAPEGDLRPEPGRAFWLTARESHRLDTAPASGRSTPTDLPCRVQLAPGWNQVGNPFLFPVAWSVVRAETQKGGAVAVEPPVAWDETQGAYGTTDIAVLQPFEGYWVWNPASATVDMLIPPDELAPRTPPVPEPAAGSEWRVQIVAHCESARDLANFAGVAAAALQGADALDRTEPPAVPGTALSLYFLTDEGQRRTIDLRPTLDDAADPSARGQRWAFDMTWSGKAGAAPGVRLEFPGLDQVPSGIELHLVDRTLERMTNLREQPPDAILGTRSSFATGPADARFELIAGTAEFVAQLREGLDRRARLTRLLPVSPNPVVSSTVVRFEIARAGQVQLAVYDLAGRRVRTLVDEKRDAGFHEMLWAGDDDRGVGLAPGIYALRLSSVDGNDARRLSRIR